VQKAVDKPPSLYKSRCDSSPLPANNRLALEPCGAIAEK
jgi:hypothetical protein